MSGLRISREEQRLAVERYKLVGVHCASCKNLIEKTLSGIDGVKYAEVDPNTGLLRIELEENADRGRVLREIRRLGYDAVTSKAIYRVKGLRSGSTAPLVRALKRVKGIVNVSVFESEGLLSVVYNPEETGEDAIEATLRGSGYQVERVEASSGGDESGIVKILPLPLAGLASLLLGLAFGVEVLAPLGALLAYIAAVKVFVLPALQAARRGYTTMDTLLALGTTGALIVSIYSLLAGGAAYWDAVVFITLFVVAGRSIEERLRRKANRRVMELKKVIPARALVNREGRLVEVPSDTVRPGEIVVVRTGDSIPVDGRVHSGRGRVDEAPLTGESIARSVEPGSIVLAGSLLVEGGLEVTALRVGEYTLARRAVRASLEASLSKPRLARIADRIVGMFTSVVIGVSLLTFTVWLLILGSPPVQAAIRAVTVLVAACPCALGIAVPAALAAGVTRAFHIGGLVRNPDALEGLARVDTAVFDKTGTLTRGDPKVSSIVVAEGWSEDELLAIAAAAEERSNHPIAAAIRKEAERRGLELPRVKIVEEMPGRGLYAELDIGTVVVGNNKLMEEFGAEGTLREPPGSHTTVYVVVNGVLAGAIGISDPVRSEAREAIERLRSRGLQVYVLTGDSERGARLLAQALGLSMNSIYYGMDPIEKKDKIEELRSKGRRVVFTGDGINDAAALAAADVGIAVEGALDAAKEAGDIVLAREDLGIIPRLFMLGKAASRTVRLNLAWALLYNALLIPAAAGVFIPLGLDVSPSLAAGAMSFSSISVTLNSLALLRWKPKV